MEKRNHNLEKDSTRINFEATSNMGKKSKKPNKNSETNESKSETVDVADNISKDKKPRKRKNNNESSHLVNKKKILENEETGKEEPLNKENKSKTRKKLKESDLITEMSEDQKTSELTSKKSKQINQPEKTHVEKTSSKNDKVKNKNKTKQYVQSKNKKIIFEEDTGEPVEEGNENDNRTEKEEDVKDEDIDQFCDDITEEDNVQYENWVQLIEAKLKNNKLKSKT